MAVLVRLRFFPKNKIPPPDMGREHAASWCHPISVIAHPFAPCGGDPCDFGILPYTPAPALSFPDVSARAFSQGPLSGAEDRSGTAVSSMRCPYSTPYFPCCQFTGQKFRPDNTCRLRVPVPYFSGSSLPDSGDKEGVSADGGPGLEKNRADFEKNCVFFVKTRKKTLSIFTEIEYNDYRAVIAETPQHQGMWR